MLEEVDFSKGVRGSHYGRVRIVGATEDHTPLRPDNAGTETDHSLQEQIDKTQKPEDVSQ